MNSNIKDSGKIHHKGTKVLFKNPWIERLSRNHISIPITIFLIVSTILLYWSAIEIGLHWLPIVGLFFVGFIAFTLLEYLVHKYVFHMIPDTEMKEKIQYNMHGIHHEFPKDKDRLAMPPIISLPVSFVLLILFKLVMGNLAFAFLPGFLIGYSSYLFVHYAVHAFPPPKNFLKVLWVHHGIHHYKNHDVAFGVSSPLWDYIFRTTPKKG